MFSVVNEKGNTIFESDNFMEAANQAMLLYNETQESLSVVQEIWNTDMLMEEIEIENNLKIA